MPGNNNNGAADKEWVPRYHKRPAGYTRRGTGRGRGRGMTRVTVTRNRSNNNNSNANIRGLKLLKNSKGKPPLHPRPPRGPYPVEEERVFNRRQAAAAEPEEQSFLEYLNERSKSKGKPGQKVALEKLEKMSFGNTNSKTYGNLKKMKKEEGMKWLQSQTEDFDLVGFLKMF